MSGEATRLAIGRPADVGAARRLARRVAGEAGLGDADREAVALAATELATNLLRYARGGALTVRRIGGAVGRDEPFGVRLESADEGPGIPNLEWALQDGASSSGGLGSGLPAVRRLMDEFSIESSAAGTHISAVKWGAHDAPRRPTADD